MERIGGSKMAEKNSAAFKEVSILLRSLITPYNKDGGILLSKLYEEYKEEEQEELPFRALGYSSETELLDAVENVHLVYKNDDWYVTTTPNSKTAHIHELIANQKSSNKSKATHSQGTNAGRMPTNRPPSCTQSRFSSASSCSYGYNKSRSQLSNGRSSHRQSGGKMLSQSPSNTQSRFPSPPSSSNGFNRSRPQPSNGGSAGKMPSRSSSNTQSKFSSASAIMRSLIIPENYHGGISISKLFWKYTAAAPKALTYKALGYKSFSEFLRDIDNVQITQNFVGSYVVTSSHIHANNSQLSKKRKRACERTDMASKPASKSDTEFRKPDVPSSSSSRSRHSSSNKPSNDYLSRSRSSTTTSSSSSSSLYNRSSSSRPAQSSYDRPRGNYNGSITTTPPSYGRSYSYSSVQQKTPSPPTVTKTPLSQRKVHVYLPESAKKSEPTTPPSNSSSTKSETEFRKPDVPSLSSSRSRHSSSNENSSRTRVSSSSPSNRNNIPIVLKEREQILPPSPPSPPRKIPKGPRSSSNKEEECWSFANEEDWNK